MTNWLSTVLTRRPSSSRHVGAGFDADMMRMAHELSLMAQQSPKSGTHSRTSSDRIATSREGVTESYKVYPSAVRRMPDRYHPTLSTR